jgi:hypothetical protein
MSERELTDIRTADVLLHYSRYLDVGVLSENINSFFYSCVNGCVCKEQLGGSNAQAGLDVPVILSFSPHHRPVHLLVAFFQNLIDLSHSSLYGRDQQPSKGSITLVTEGFEQRV